MTPFDGVDTATLLSGHADWIGYQGAARLSRPALDCLETEFPHHVGRVDGPDGPERPRERHPVFYGCYDWHSAVHAHWTLVRGLRLFDDHPARAEAVDRIDARLTADGVAREVKRFEVEPTFERPYGWGWFLRLAAELSLWDDGRAAEWRAILDPLERRIVTLVESDLRSRSRPNRVGTHGNTAFALCCVLDYARTTGADGLAAAVVEAATDHFATDRDAPVAYEPFGLDFLSPSLTEADLLRRVFDPGRFAAWFDDFLPGLDADGLALDPVEAPANPTDGTTLHLIGLNLSRAWCLAGVAETLDRHRDGAAEAVRRCGARHAERGVSRAFTDAYAGSHWLPSFAFYLLTRNEGGLAPDA
jgi:hypothetical protein